MFLFRSFFVDLNKGINPHVVIVGQSGSGKSNACKMLLSQLAAQGSAIAIIDPHNEYVGFAKDINAKVHDAGLEAVNLLDMRGSAKEKAGELSNMLRVRLRLGFRQYNELYKLLLYTYSICEKEAKQANMRELLYSLQVFKKNASGAELSTLESLESRLMLISSDARKEVSIEEAMDSCNVYALMHLHSSEAQAVYAEAFLRQVYARMLEHKHGQMYIVVEEAEKLENSQVLSRLAAEGRKYGVGIIAVSQRLKAVDKELRSNASMLFAFYQREPDELNYIANTISGGNELGRFIAVKKALRNLSRGTALIMQNSKEPEIVRFRRFHGNSENCEYLLMQMLVKPKPYKEIISIGSTQCSSDEVDMLLESLEQKGAIKSYTVSTGALAGKWYTGSAKNSAEHDIMVEVIRRNLASRGISARVLNKAYAPDLEALENDMRIAVEYETGKKSVLSTLEMLEGRSAKYSSIVVVVSSGAKEFENELREKVKASALRDKCSIVSSSDFLAGTQRLA